MFTQFHFPSLSSRLLAPGEFQALAGREGDLLLCRRGRLLVTVEGVREDFDLRAGTSLRLGVGGRVVIEAIDAAVVEVVVRHRVSVIRKAWRKAQNACFRFRAHPS